MGCSANGRLLDFHSSNMGSSPLHPTVGSIRTKASIAACRAADAGSIPAYSAMALSAKGRPLGSQPRNASSILARAINWQSR